MSRPRKEARLVWRRRPNGKRYAYVRYHDPVSGEAKRDPLTRGGSTQATQDTLEAQELFTEWLRAFKRQATPRGKVPLFSVFAGHVLAKKLERGKAEPSHLANNERSFRQFDRIVGDRPLDCYSVDDMRKFQDALAPRLKPGSVRHALNALSSVFRYAIEAGHVARNPVAMMVDKPVGRGGNTPFLTAQQAVAALDAACELGPETERIVALYLYTGARRAEIMGLRAEDVDLGGGRIRIVPHAGRRLKTRSSERVVPLWSELRAVLGPWLVPLDRTPLTGYLFPGRAGGYLRDARKQLDAVARKAGLPVKLLRGRPMRVTYVSHRVQTTDRGAPVSFFTVARECGHSVAVCESIYARLPELRYRGEEVAYRAAVVSGPAIGARL